MNPEIESPEVCNMVYWLLKQHEDDIANEFIGTVAASVLSRDSWDYEDRGHIMVHGHRGYVDYTPFEMYEEVMRHIVAEHETLTSKDWSLVDMGHFMKWFTKYADGILVARVINRIMAGKIIEQ